MYDSLTNLASVRAWLGIPVANTNDDVLLQGLIPSASELIGRYCSRDNLGKAKTYTKETYWNKRGPGATPVQKLQLESYPIISLAAFLVNGQAQTILTDPTNCPTGVFVQPDDQPRSVLMFGIGWPQWSPIQVTYTAGYQTSETDTIPATPFQVTPKTGGLWSADAGVINATTGVALVPVTANPATGQYSVAAGVYTFAAADVGVSVTITYSFIPPLLTQACNRQVSEWYKSRDFIAQKSKSLQGEVVSYDMSAGALSDAVKALIQVFVDRVPTP